MRRSLFALYENGHASAVMTSSSDDEDGDVMYEGEWEAESEWSRFLYTINGEDLLKRQAKLQDLWMHLRRHEPELLDTFELFLDNAIREIDEIRCDRNIALMSKERSERSIQSIYIELERILEEERTRIQREFESKYHGELRHQMTKKQRELDDVVQLKVKLELQLSDLTRAEVCRSDSIRHLSQMVDQLTVKEQALSSENDLLYQENRKLQMQLSASIENLQKTQELCAKLQQADPPQPASSPQVSRRAATAAAPYTQKQDLKLDLDVSNASSDGVPDPAASRKVRVATITQSAPAAVESECDQVNYTSVVPRTPDRMYKLIVVGDSNVGKTSIIHKLCYDAFDDDRRPTLDITYNMKTMVTTQGVTSLQIWDTAGQERFRSIPKLYYRKSDAVFLVYDVSSEASFSNVGSWLASIADSPSCATLLMLMANKIDTDKRVVATERGERMAQSCKALYAEVSARTGHNLHQAFESVVRVLQEQEESRMGIPTRRGSRIFLEKSDGDVAKKRKCCR